MIKVKEILLFFIICFLCVSCQSSNGNQGAAIIFGDVIGSYTGQCADYDVNSLDLLNREVASLSLSAANTNEAKIRVSCGRFEDLQVAVKTASASEIIFEKSISVDVFVQLTYFAAEDSVSLTQTGSDTNIIFTGIRD